MRRKQGRGGSSAGRTHCHPPQPRHGKTLTLVLALVLALSFRNPRRYFGGAEPGENARHVKVRHGGGGGWLAAATPLLLLLLLLLPPPLVMVVAVLQLLPPAPLPPAVPWSPAALTLLLTQWRRRPSPSPLTLQISQHEPWSCPALSSAVPRLPAPLPLRPLDGGGRRVR